MVKKIYSYQQDFLNYNGRGNRSTELTTKSLLLPSILGECRIRPYNIA